MNSSDMILSTCAAQLDSIWHMNRPLDCATSQETHIINNNGIKYKWLNKLDPKYEKKIYSSCTLTCLNKVKLPSTSTLRYKIYLWFMVRNGYINYSLRVACPTQFKSEKLFKSWTTDRTKGNWKSLGWM